MSNEDCEELVERSKEAVEKHDKSLSSKTSIGKHKEVESNEEVVEEHGKLSSSETSIEECREVVESSEEVLEKNEMSEKLQRECEEVLKEYENIFEVSEVLEPKEESKCKSPEVNGQMSWLVSKEMRTSISIMLKLVGTTGMKTYRNLKSLVAQVINEYKVSNVIDDAEIRVDVGRHKAPLVSEEDSVHEEEKNKESITNVWL